MDRRHHTSQEITQILQELDFGSSVDQVLSKYRISKATLYRWRKKAQKTETAHVKRLQQVAEENKRLRSLLSDAALEIHALKEKINRPD